MPLPHHLVAKEHVLRCKSALRHLMVPLLQLWRIFCWYFVLLAPQPPRYSVPGNGSPDEVRGQQDDARHRDEAVLDAQVNAKSSGTTMEVRTAGQGRSISGLAGSFSLTRELRFHGILSVAHRVACAPRPRGARHGRHFVGRCSYFSTRFRALR